MSKELAKQLTAEAGVLDGQRAPWDSLWQELADVVHPRRGMVTRRSSTMGAVPDRRKVAEAFDGTAARANRTLANGQFARITPMGARWFVCKPPAELPVKPEAAAWYQRCSEVLAAKLYASNFYARAHEHFLDRGAFGTAATEVTGGQHGKGLHFRSFAVGSYSVAQNANDEVETLHRSYTLTPRQLVEKFPETCPAEIRRRARDAAKGHQPVTVRQAVYRRLDRDPRKVDGANKAFASVHWLPETQTVLAEGGYEEFPCAVSRWELWGDAPYGWAPSYLALPEAVQANFLEQMLDTAAEVAVFPRVLYGASLKGDVDFRALGLTCYDPQAGEAPREWLTQGRYDVGKDRVRDKRQAINEAFFVPLFNSISQLQHDATATEVQAIVTESRELFHPIFAGLTREFLVPLLRRAFSILLRQGEFPAPPAAVVMRDELGAYVGDPAVEFVSSMALALEQSHLGNLRDCLSVLQPFMAQDPAVVDFIDVDRVGPALFRAKGLPEEFIRPAKEVEKLRAARAQAQQMAQAREAAGAVKDLGGAEGIEGLGRVMGG
ncbi:portal protein [Luteolibacter sp. LG18]|uniref:portal protein n=1 Tax=Luteolibacter sp. LG18 TaxID=2819286 RepID=UPI002B28DD74|nr:phage head-tail connector protein [Luteolibacter sp. LG18]